MTHGCHDLKAYDGALGDTLFCTPQYTADWQDDMAAVCRASQHCSQSPLYDTLAAWLSSAPLFLDLFAVHPDFSVVPSALQNVV